MQVQLFSWCSRADSCIHTKANGAELYLGQGGGRGADSKHQQAEVKAPGRLQGSMEHSHTDICYTCIYNEYTRDANIRGTYL